MRRGHFWIAGERIRRDGKTFQRGPMFVEWETPDTVTRPYPVVLVHSGPWKPPQWDQFIAGYGPLPAELAKSEDMDADRLARLPGSPARSGPTTSVAKPAPHRAVVVGIVSIEPIGPPFAGIPNIGPLRWGLTASPLTFDPPCPTPQAVRNANPATLRLPHLAGLPVAVVTGDTSAFERPLGVRADD